MIRGVREAASAMSIQMARQEVLARNVANSSTVAYKQEFAPVEGSSVGINQLPRDSRSGYSVLASQLPEIGSLGTEIEVPIVAVDFRQGALQETNRTLDLALDGDGFMEARTPEGDYFFRGGVLHVDAENRVVTDEGYFVLGSEGEVLTLGEGDLTIGRDGTINLDGAPVARLSVVEFAPGTVLAKASDGLYTVDGLDGAFPTEAANTVVRQGFLEGSNVDQVSAMTEMVSGLRAYQVSQRMLVAQDDLLGRAVNEVGRI